MDYCIAFGLLGFGERRDEGGGVLYDVDVRPYLHG